MMSATASDDTIGLFQTAVAMTVDMPSACFALVAAALTACQVGLRDKLPAVAVDELEAVLAHAGAVLIEAGHGPLDLAEPAGAA